MTAQEQLDRIMAKLATDYQKLNARQQTFAINEIGRVRLEIGDMLADYAGDDGTIKKQRLNRLLRDLESIEKSVRTTGEIAFTKVIDESSSFAIAGASSALVEAVGAATISGIAFDRINKHVLEYVTRRFADDGLVLSDRVWNLAGEQRDQLSKVLRSGIIRGESVSKMIAGVRQVYDNETWKIRRLVVTEGNTAMRTAVAYNGRESNLVHGIRIHRGKANRPDHKCTVLELANSYDLGTGVYPTTASEVYNPHVNCTSTLTYELVEREALFRNANER